MFSDYGGDENKIVFIVFFLGGVLRRKLARVCDAMNVHLYLYPENAGDVEKQRAVNDTQVAELKRVLKHTKQTQADLLSNVAQRVGSWKRLFVFFSS